MRVLYICPKERVIRPVTGQRYINNGQFDSRNFLGRTELFELQLHDGSLLIFDANHLCSDSRAFIYEDNGVLYPVFGRAVFIPRIQQGEFRFWQNQIDEMVSFYRYEFSKVIKSRILTGGQILYPDERIVGMSATKSMVNKYAVGGGGGSRVIPAIKRAIFGTLKKRYL